MDEDLMAEVQREMKQWRSTHPHATFAEIEQAVEEQSTRTRVQLLEQVLADGPKQQQPLCSACGTTMVLRPQAQRLLTVNGDEAVHLERSYVVCPSCGTGLFSPGSGVRAAQQLLNLHPSVTPAMVTPAIASSACTACAAAGGPSSE